MAVLRTFIAVELPEPVRAVLAEVSRQAASCWPANAVRWVRIDGIHLTLRFLGDTGEDRLPELRNGLDRLAAGLSAFDLSLAGTGCFPNPRRPRVVWVGVADPEECLSRLQRGVEHLVRELGWEREGRPFQAHLTLGRVREPAGPAPADWAVPVEPLSFRVDRIALIESRLRPEGAEYHRLHAASLTG
ncbi:MAG: RNA 2',3'-cyclic phosphodiesterase [Candidatus Latescibacterota bacterium]|jgi:2'-5' RNA ligase